MRYVLNAGQALAWLLLAAFALMIAAPARAEANLCWNPSANQWQRCATGVTVQSRATPGNYGDYDRGVARLFEQVPASEAVYICEADIPIGSGEGCPAPRDYSRERYVLKSSLSSTPPPPPPPPPPTDPIFKGDAVICWTPPTQNTDGSALTNLAGHRVHYGRSVGTLQLVVDAPTPQTCKTLEQLEEGPWFAGVTAYTSTGAESVLSSIVSKYIAPPPPPPVDCVVSDWGPWIEGAWSACASGQRSRIDQRFRTIVTPAANGGAACPMLLDERVVTEACGDRYVVKAIASGTRPAYELVRDQADTAWVQGYKLGDIRVGSLCDSVRQFGTSTTAYHKVNEADVVLLSPTYRGRTLVAVCAKL